MNDKIKNSFKKIKEEQARLSRELRKSTIGYIIAAFGFVAAFAWNDAIKAIIQYFFPLDSNSLLAKLFSAFIITIIVVIVSVYLMRLAEDKKENEVKV